jgi:hypothetical protein
LLDRFRFGDHLVDEIGLTGESLPVDRSCNRPDVSDTDMTARFTDDPL